MIAVKTTVPICFYPRTQKTGIIIIEATAINPQGDFYRIDLIDKAAQMVIIDGEEKEVITEIEKRIIYKPISQVNALFNAVQMGISPTDDYNEKERLIKIAALLLFIQNDFIDVDNTKTIYNLLPNQWTEYVGQ